MSDEPGSSGGSNGLIWGYASPETLPAILSIESQAYDFPWTQGMLQECLASGHIFRTLMLSEQSSHEPQLVAYGVVKYAVGESHLLNLCVHPEYRGAQLGRTLLRRLIEESSEVAQAMYLEVRASNRAALHLYASMGFMEIGRRAKYYRAPSGREDALIFALSLV